MSNMKNDSTNASQHPAKKRPSEETAVSARLEKDADEMAEAATKTEEQYDEEHDIFTK